jgi:hypothetical protein
METPAIPNKITIPWVAKERTLLWFEKYDPLYPEEIHPDTDPKKVKLCHSISYDYEMLPGNKPRIHFDIGVRVFTAAAISVRTQIESECNEYDWNVYFRKDVIEFWIRIALRNCTEEFRKQCNARNIKINTSLKPEPELVRDIVNGVYQNYLDFRSKDDITNKKGIESPGLILQPDRIKTIIPIDITFMILQDVFYYNKNFNRKKNLENFDKAVPEYLYHTVRMKAMKIVSEEVNLSMYYTTYFLICLDCALQLILGEAEQELLTSLQSKGLTLENRDIFIKEGSNILNYFLEALREKNSSVNKLEEKHDWNRLIR